jgi:hypothetical protein
MLKTRDIALHSRNKKCKVLSDSSLEGHVIDAILFFKDSDKDLIPSEWFNWKCSKVYIKKKQKNIKRIKRNLAVLQNCRVPLHLHTCYMKCHTVTQYLNLQPVLYTNSFQLSSIEWVG